MKMVIQHVHLRSTDQLDSLVEESIFALQPRLRIDEAKVRLECRWQESPAYRVAVHLVTPGTDVTAEGRDHTIRAAIGKAAMDLEAKLGQRARQPLRRMQSNRQNPACFRGPHRRRA